jgi:DNA polymerase IIIc chi subunit
MAKIIRSNVTEIVVKCNQENAIEALRKIIFFADDGRFIPYNVSLAEEKDVPAIEWIFYDKCNGIKELFEFAEECYYKHEGSEYEIRIGGLR